MTSRTIITLTLGFLLAVQCVQSQLPTPSCLPEYSWMNNSLGQSPCLVASLALDACSGNYNTVDPLGTSADGTAGTAGNGSYPGPSKDSANVCICNTVTYSLYQACGTCQNGTYHAWSDYKTNCSDVAIGLSTFPKPIPENTTFPPWAYLDATGNFDVGAAEANSTTFQSTAIPTGTTSTSSTISRSTTSPSSVVHGSPNTAAIIGGVIGGLAFVAALAAVTVYLLRRRRESHSDPADTYYGAGPQKSPPSMSDRSSIAQQPQPSYEPYRAYSLPHPPQHSTDSSIINMTSPPSMTFTHASQSSSLPSSVSGNSLITDPNKLMPGRRRSFISGRAGGNHILKSRSIDSEDAMKKRWSEEEAKLCKPSVTLPVSTFPSDGCERLDEVLPLTDLQTLSRETPIDTPLDLTTNVSRAGQYPSATGGFADVWKGEWYDADGKRNEVAIKVLRACMGDPAKLFKLQKRLRRELRVWQRLKHKNVLVLHGIASNFGPHPGFVCPWLANGCISKYLTKRDGDLLMSHRLQLLCEVADGLSYLHASGVVHGDLTGANILIADDGSACLCDFGLSSIAAEFQGTSYITSTMGGNVRWAAPELLRTDENGTVPMVNIYSDAYSYGSVTLEILSGQIPFPYLLNDAQVVMQVYIGVKSSRPENPDVTDQLWAFINKCWADAPTARPTAEEIAQSMRRFLNEIA